MEVFLLGKNVGGEVEVSQSIGPILLLTAHAARVVQIEGVTLKVRLTGVEVAVVAVRSIEAGIPDEVQGEGVCLLPTGPFNRLWPWVPLLCL